ncbi:sigma-54-dependent Fis family transcriptional regulator [candidate division KSB1 bacterium]|nr:sigma-54-dependent Fis family transcriptional regulator [candidate division KSB1 bacterium]
MDISENILENKLILIIDDDVDVIDSFSAYLKLNACKVISARDISSAMKLIDEFDIDLILIDLVLNDSNRLAGMELLAYVMNRNPEQLVILFSGYGTIEIAVDAIKMGAYDFLTKPIEPERFLLTVKNAMKSQALEKEQRLLLEDLKEKYRLIGISQSIQTVRQLIKRVAPLDKTALIVGETGTGKELVARSIYYESKRKSEILYRMNCAAIPETLIESELFGYEKGAFTGADKIKIGAFEKANKGTIFLDEIGDLSLSAQAKVLRVLDFGEFTRIGGDSIIKVDTRIICATNKNLETMIEEKVFREDLYHRINVFKIYIPPLRQRKEDIVPLVDHYMREICNSNNIKLKLFTDDAINVMMNMNWPGNVRELINALERVVHYSDARTIDSGTLLTLMSSNTFDKHKPLVNDLRQARDNFEKYFILAKLNEYKWNISRTAEVIGLERTQLYRKIKKYNIRK